MPWWCWGKEPAMEDRLGDLMHCEEQLRNTLISNDKEKLRRKLVLLQREYLRTAQRLKRAEHIDSVRGHVRSKIIQHNQPVQNKADDKPSSSSVEVDRPEKTFTGTVKNQQLSPDLVTASDNNAENRTRMTQFAPLSDAPFTPTSTSSQDSSQISRASPALRLRSRRSRLRWEKKSAESDLTAPNCQTSPEKSGGKEEEETQTTHLSQTNLHESEELFPPSETDSPTLLLSHWNLQGQAETVKSKNKPLTPEKGINTTPNELTSASLSSEAKDLHLPTDNRHKLADVCEKKIEHVEDKDVAPQQIQREIKFDNAAEIKDEKKEPEDGGQRLLDSCTLVEGLLFPVEYYVRTTRRMALSQSQSDMNAIILSHLIRGRPRRSRGRGRKLHRTVSEDGQNNESNMELLVSSKNENGSPGCCDGISVSTPLNISNPGRGRRGRRGRGRGRGRGRTGRLRLEGDTQTDDISASLSSPKLCLSSEEVLVNAVQPEGTNGLGTNSTAIEAYTSTDTPNVQIYPIFVKTNQRSANCRATNADLQSLLLPSSSPVLNGQVSSSSLNPFPLLKELLISDIQDFHLPDDQFASLKLLKLRQKEVVSGVEQLTPRSCNARSNNTHYTSSPIHISLSPCPTPDITSSPTSQLAPNDCTTSHTLAENNILDFSEDQKNVSSLSECVAELDVSEVLGQGRQDVQVLCSPEILKSPESPTDCEGSRRVMTSSNEAIESKSLFTEDEESINLNKTIMEKENQGIDLLAQIESRFVPKIIPEKLTKIDSDAKAEDSQNLKKTAHELESAESCLAPHKVPSQLLLSPSLHPPSCPLTLPLLGFTPRPVNSPPLLALPPAHSPTSEARSPPVLSPCPSRSPLPPSLPPLTPTDNEFCQDQCEPSQVPPAHPGDQQGGTVQRVDGVQPSCCTFTLQAPAGSTLVDACCVQSSSGSLCVAAAGKWAVCLWGGREPSGWNLTHTWTFNEPVISVFPVPDAADLLCVTLGQLEITEVRVLWCSRLVQTVLCDGVIQTVIGFPQSRVVSSTQTTSTSILRVFTLSDESSAPDCHPLVSPGGSVGSLAPVEGLPDALIGTDESGCLFIWNVKTGHLLQRVTLGDGLSHSACLRGYSDTGVLFVLMQHHFLGSVRVPDDSVKTETDERRTALFSLVAVNPRNGKSALAAPFYQPQSWCGRLCEADTVGCSLVGLSQRGGVCLWDLKHPGDPQAVRAPESEGWQLARWGGPNLLLTALHSGDVTLHCYGDCRRLKSHCIRQTSVKGGQQLEHEFSNSSISLSDLIPQHSETY